MSSPYFDVSVFLIAVQSINKQYKLVSDELIVTMLFLSKYAMTKNMGEYIGGIKQTFHDEK